MLREAVVPVTVTVVVVVDEIHILMAVVEEFDSGIASDNNCSLDILLRLLLLLLLHNTGVAVVGDIGLASS